MDYLNYRLRNNCLKELFVALIYWKKFPIIKKVEYKTEPEWYY